MTRLLLLGIWVGRYSFPSVLAKGNTNKQCCDGKRRRLKDTAKKNVSKRSPKMSACGAGTGPTAGEEGG